MLGPWTDEGSEDFLEEFGMPTILWRVLHLVGYQEGQEPQYDWHRVQLSEDRHVYTVEVDVPSREDQDHVWCRRVFALQGRTPWDAANQVAYTALRDIMEDHPEVVAQATASIFPTTDPYQAVWRQSGATVLEASSLEREHCAGPAGSAMAALMATYGCLSRSYEQLDHVLSEEIAAQHRRQEEHTTEIDLLTTQLAQLTVERDQALQREQETAHQLAIQQGSTTFLASVMRETEEALRGVCVEGIRVSEENRLLRLRVGDLELQLHHLEDYNDRLHEEIHRRENERNPIFPQEDPEPSSSSSSSSDMSSEDGDVGEIARE